MDNGGKAILGCGSVLADAIGEFSCTPAVPIPAGAQLSVISIDSTGVASEPTHVTVVAIIIELSHDQRHASETQTVTGYNFNTGETVKMVVYFSMLGNTQVVYDGGTQVASADGTVGFTFLVPAEAGFYTVILTGGSSGTVDGALEVMSSRVPSSGARDPSLYGVVALMAVGATFLFVGATRIKVTSLP
jgi:hypothetical protein